MSITLEQKPFIKYGLPDFRTPTTVLPENDFNLSEQEILLGETAKEMIRLSGINTNTILDTTIPNFNEEVLNADQREEVYFEGSDRPVDDIDKPLSEIEADSVGLIPIIKSNKVISILVTLLILGVVLAPTKG